MKFVFRIIRFITKKVLVGIEYLQMQYSVYDKISNIYKEHHEYLVNLHHSAKSYKKKWTVLSRFVFAKYYKVYTSISGKDDINYVPENIFYCIIEPTLNDTSLSIAYSDKNYYDRLPSFSTLFPKTCIRNIDGVFYDDKYCYIDDKKTGDFLTRLKRFTAPQVILKPSVDSWGGRNVLLFIKEHGVYRDTDGNTLDLKFLQSYQNKNYIVQEAIEQYQFYKQFNPSSLNTIRVFTYRSTTTEKVAVLHCVLRMGRDGSITDNQSAGGISCGIDENGKLNDFAVNKKGDIFHYAGEGKELSFTSIGSVYKLGEIKKLAKECAIHFYYHRILSFDFCVDKRENVRLIEINNKSMEINFLQMNNGPLFGEYTDEVIEYCKNNRK